ncbi:MAG: cytosine permease, partial [Steroidobacteraceae bacterium]|nr:cytosine permease [Steroidobacteraceae bacterium]
MASALANWWRLDAAREQTSADNPLAPLAAQQRRPTLPLLTLAFGWGFLVTGLIVGSSLGAGLTFWPDLVRNALYGNLANFAIGALVGYMGFRTACNSGLLYRLTYGNAGAYIPVLSLALLTIGWQGIVVGAFGLTWTGSFDSPWFYPVAIFAGVLYTATTYFGVKGLERVGLPSTVVLVAVGLYAGWYNVQQAGGWEAFLQKSAAAAAVKPLTDVQAVNIVIGSWIVGAIVMAEYTRFARRAWVAIAIPFIVLVVAQWFLQIVGAMGGVVSGTYDFTAYMKSAGFWIGLVGLIAMSLALWTTGDTNLYLPSIQTASVFRRPKRVMVVICGTLGTLLGLKIFQYFIQWIEQLANLVPPIIGPVIVDYYLIHRGRYRTELLERLPAWNVPALLAFVTGIAAAYAFTPPWIASGLFGLLISMAA